MRVNPSYRVSAYSPVALVNRLIHGRAGAPDDVLPEDIRTASCRHGNRRNSGATTAEKTTIFAKPPVLADSSAPQETLHAHPLDAI